MSDEYLWDGSGVPDREVQRLEQVLGRLGSAPPPLRLPGPSRRRASRFVPLLAAAAVILLIVGLTRRAARETERASAWEVARLSGQPRIGTRNLGDTGRLGVGEMLVTDASSSARI